MEVVIASKELKHSWDLMRLDCAQPSPTTAKTLSVSWQYINRRNGYSSRVPISGCWTNIFVIAKPFPQPPLTCQRSWQPVLWDRCETDRLPRCAKMLLSARWPGLSNNCMFNNQILSDNKSFLKHKCQRKSCEAGPQFHHCSIALTQLPYFKHRWRLKLPNQLSRCVSTLGLVHTAMLKGQSFNLK